jgi:hypothetical protein
MKRADVEVDKKYADNHGRCISVVALDPGWTVRDDKYIQAKVFERRYTRGKFVEYQSNFAVRAVWHNSPSKGGDIPIVIEPRKIVNPWVEHQKARKIAQAVMGTKQDAVAQWQDVLAEKGVRAPKIDYDKKTITVTLAEMHRLLGQPEGVTT